MYGSERQVVTRNTNKNKNYNKCDGTYKTQNNSRYLQHIKHKINT